MKPRHLKATAIPFLFGHVRPTTSESPKRVPEKDTPQQASVDRSCNATRPVPTSYDMGGVWLPRRKKILASPRVSYVYLLVHQTQNRFKIGKSLAPKTRFANLPEANEVDVLRSMQVVLRDQIRAGQIESLLHKALADFRLDRLAWYGVQDLTAQLLPGWAWDDCWDGETEWFALPAFRHAVEILKKIPGLNGPPVSALQTLEGQPWPEKVFKPDPQEQLFAAMQTYNLARFDEIFDVLLVISRQHKIVWIPALEPQTSAGSLRIESFKSQWAPDMVNVRFQVTCSALWEFKTHHPRTVKKHLSQGDGVLVDEVICPLVKLITYSKTQPEDLELIFNSADALSSVPGGTLVLERVLAFTVGFTEIKDRTVSNEPMRQESKMRKEPK